MRKIVPTEETYRRVVSISVDLDVTTSGRRLAKSTLYPRLEEAVDAMVQKLLDEDIPIVSYKTGYEHKRVTWVAASAALEIEEEAE